MGCRNVRVITRTILLGAAAGSLAFVLSGCGLGIFGASAAVAGSGGTRTAPDVPSVTDLVLVAEDGQSRPLNTDGVTISFELSESTSELADILVEYQSGESWLPISLGSPDSDGIIEELETSRSGTSHTVLWFAELNGFTGYNEVNLRITASDSDGVGPAEVLESASFGNDAPAVSNIDVVGESGTANGNIVVRFDIADSASDNVSVELLYSTDGSNFENACVADDSSSCPQIIAGNLSGLTMGGHDLTWDSVSSIGAIDADEVTLAIRATDVFGAQSTLAQSTIFRVENGSLPDLLLVIEDPAMPGRAEPTQLALTVIDAEDDSADIVLQWSTDGSDFPDLSSLSDAEERTRVLQNADERARLRILEPRAKEVLRSTIQSSSGGTVVLDPPIVAVPFDSRLVQASVELLSSVGIVEQTRSISAFDPGRHRLTLDSAFDPEPSAGSTVVLRESATQLLLGVPAVDPTSGTPSRFDWDRAEDVPLALEQEGFFIRSRAYAGASAGSSFSSVLNDVESDAVEVPLRRGSSIVSTHTMLHPVLVDLDSDGFLDLATHSLDFGGGSASVAVVLADSDGILDAAATEYASVLIPQDLAAGDLDGDGHADLVSVVNNGGAGELRAYLGSTDGSLAAIAALNTNEIAVAVRLVDTNLDNVLDAVIAGTDGFDQRIAIYTGDGDGTFTVGPQVAESLNPSGLEIGDFNSDGRPDLAYLSTEDAFRICLGNDSNSFELSATFNTTLSPEVSAVGDFNSDGLDDLAVAQVDSGSFNPVAGRIGLYLSNGDGTFSESSMTLETVGECASLVAADIDGDGIDDLASLSRVADADNVTVRQLELFSGNGDTTFRDHQATPLTVVEFALTAGDLNLDGKTDLVGAGTALIVPFYAREFVSKDPISKGSAPTDIAVGDVNGDGNPDLILSGRAGSSAEVSIHLGEGDGGFESEDVIFSGEDDCDSVAVADLDGDGNLDLVFGTGEFFPVTVTELRVLHGSGNGSFSTTATLTARGQPRSIHLHDLDRDGELDALYLALEDSGLSSLVYRLGDGQGSFGEEIEILVPDNYQACEVGYLNADENLDLACYDTDDNEIQVHTGGASLTFALADTVAASTSGSLALGDVDGDGSSDLLFVGADGGNGAIRRAFGNGDGTFGASEIVGESFLNSEVVLGDLNGDGRLDVLTESLEPNITFGRPTVYQGLGDGEFGPAVYLSVISSNTTNTVADVNRDGHLDVVSASGDFNRVTVVLGTPQGRFDRASIYGRAVPSTPGIGSGDGGALDLSFTHVIDTSAGTIDGVRSSAFVGHAFHVSSLAVSAGSEVTVRGDHPLVFLVTGDVTIEGLLDVSGVDGGSLGDTRGRPVGATGGRGGPGGGNGGAGGGLQPGTGTLDGGHGAGAGAGGAGRTGIAVVASGGGGGHSAAGTAGSTGAAGGSSYSASRLSRLHGGSGGGGGSARDDNLSDGLNADAGVTGDDGGGGGGGGGGALRITCGGTLRIVGQILANGGGGGTGNADFGGNGGGGSGGSILLQARGGVTVETGSTISANGGTGATSASADAGGDGAAGYVRIEDSDGTVNIQGSVSPAATIGTISIP
ncbi:MAG: VCBS repeat-containing protein [Planctomycetota bacterium]